MNGTHHFYSTSVEIAHSLFQITMPSWFSRTPSLQYGKESFDTKIGTVYTAYDPKSPPQHPGPQWTRFVCISDTHSETFDVPPGDVLLHSGDLSKLGKYDQLKVTVDWLRGLPHRVKMLVHDAVDLARRSESRQHHSRQSRSSSPRSLVCQRLPPFPQTERGRFCLIHCHPAV